MGLNIRPYPYNLQVNMKFYALKRVTERHAGKLTSKINWKTPSSRGQLSFSSKAEQKDTANSAAKSSVLSTFGDFS